MARFEGSPSARKPLGQKAYGHIPHLPGSRMGPADKMCEPGQARLVCERVRDKLDHVVVQEKLDGSNVAVAKIDGQIVPLVRSGYVANTSPFEQHQVFHQWVFEQHARFDALLGEGERCCGEWLMQAHGTRYALPHEPFVVFDLMHGFSRTVSAEVERRVRAHGFTTPRLLHTGSPLSVARVLEMLETSGHGALDPIEGAIWRLERAGTVEFLAKFVRPEKRDGVYLPEVSGQPVVWNWRPKI
jgi:hypothetical protein